MMDLKLIKCKTPITPGILPYLPMSVLLDIVERYPTLVPTQAPIALSSLKYLHDNSHLAFTPAQLAFIHNLIWM